MIPRKRAKPRQLGIAAQMDGVKLKKRKTKYARRNKYQGYVDFIRSKPCVICQKFFLKFPRVHFCLDTEAAHTGKRAGFRKSDNRTFSARSGRCESTPADTDTGTGSFPHEALLEVMVFWKQFDESGSRSICEDGNKS